MATLVIENVPDDLVEGLHKRAAQHRTTVNAEVLDIIGGMLTAYDDSNDTNMTPAEFYAFRRASGFLSPDESVAMIREDRDRADGRR